MQAIIATGGRQFRVAKGQKISVNKLDAVEASDVTLPAVATVDGDKITLGKGKVVAKILRQHKGEKVVSATFKRRKGLHKKKGHRQALTEIQIQDIQA